MNLFYIIFGWRKASKCKKLIKRVQCRIKLSKNKRYSMITHLREDIIQLLKGGLDRSAFARVGQLSKDQNIVAAYELLDHFCELIIMNLSYIRRNRDCPNDINEAASSLLYASARCGDLPELPKLRKLFGDRYGSRFAIAAVELLSGNLVNRQLIKYLSVESISVDVKFRLMKEIARENFLEMDHLQTDIKCWQQSNDVDEFYSAMGDFDWDLQDSDPDICIGLQDVKQVETREDTKFDDVFSGSRELVIATKVDRTNFEALPSDSRELVIASKVDIPEKLDKMGELEVVFRDRVTSQRNSGICSTKVSNSSVPNKIEALTGVTTSESSFQISDKNTVYLDDVEEFLPSIQVDGNFKELRLFMFKSAYVPPGKESTEHDKIVRDSSRASLSDLFLGLGDDRIEKPVSSDGKTSSRSCTRRRRSSRRRSKRRHLYMENQMSQSPTSVCSSIKDIEYAFYYNGSWHNRKKNQKSMLVGDRGSFSFYDDEIKPQQWCGELRSPEEIRFEEMEEKFQSHKWNCQRRAKSICGCNCAIAGECSLYHPCYFVTSDVLHDWGSPTAGSPKLLLACPKGKTRTVSHFQKLRVKRDCNSIQLMKGATVPQIQHEEAREKLAPVRQENYASSRESCTRETSPWKNKNLRPPYLKAMVLPPPQKQKHIPIIRSVSFRSQQSDNTSKSSSSSFCSHIHPKLPEYDDLEARFLAIKREHSESSVLN
ncbi:hypothetical protein MKW92_009424 [Papaver armeniacum]|nr:hypothetical protein MKW92_009424 [Papaver armeniacum]